MKFTDILNLYSKQLLYELYVREKLSKEVIAKRLNICCNSVSKLLTTYNISRDNIKLKGDQTRARHQFKLQQLANSVSKDELYDQYITQNKRHSEVEAFFNLSASQVDKLLKFYGIRKSKKFSAQLGLDTKFKNAGSATNYYSNLTQKQRATLITKHGSLQKHYANVAEKVLKTKIERYGSRNYYNKAKFNQTCLEKYGVPCTCMRKEARMRGNNSKPNAEFAQMLNDRNINFTREFSLEDKSYDFKVGNVLIEINPSCTHNSTTSVFPNRLPLDKYYHKNKLDIAKKYGYRCIHVFDWDDKYKIINLLTHRERIYARQCIVKEVNIKDSVQYIDQYHLQCYARAAIHLGLYFGNELVSIMTFGKPRYNKNYEYELIRYCSHKCVIGGAEKLFAYFKSIYTPKSIISYCDDSKFTGKIYLQLGFTYVKTSISKHWYNSKTHTHILDSLLRSRGFDQLLGHIYGRYGKGSSNSELMKKFKFVEIYDSGQSVYEYKNINV